MVQNALSQSPPSEAEMATFSPADWLGLVRSQSQIISAQGPTIDALKHQLEWFKRQVFGTKSERLSVLENARQLSLAELPPAQKTNERNDKEIRIRVGRSLHSTGQEKFGALVGDSCRPGANAGLAPGTMLAPGTVVSGLRFWTKSIERARPPVLGSR
jgi:hypothetical protein